MDAASFGNTPQQLKNHLYFSVFEWKSTHCSQRQNAYRPWKSRNFVVHCLRDYDLWKMIYVTQTHIISVARHLSMQVADIVDHGQVFLAQCNQQVNWNRVQCFKNLSGRRLDTKCPIQCHWMLRRSRCEHVANIVFVNSSVTHDIRIRLKLVKWAMKMIICLWFSVLWIWSRRLLAGLFCYWEMCDVP